jgi:hypothetical protein
MAFDHTIVTQVPMTRDDAFACLIAHLDPPDSHLSFETTVREWRNLCDSANLIDDLANSLNDRFHLSLPRSAWRKVLTPDRQRTLGDVCDLIAAHATRPTFHPVTILGSTSASAAAFLAIRELLRNTGVDVSNLTPSSPLTPFVRRHAARLWPILTDLAPRTRIPVSAYNPTAGGLVLGGFLCCLAHILLRVCRAADVAPYLLGVGLACEALGISCAYLIPPTVDVGWVRTFRELSQLVAGERSPAGPGFEVTPVV